MAVSRADARKHRFRHGRKPTGKAQCIERVYANGSYHGPLRPIADGALGKLSTVPRGDSPLIARASDTTTDYAATGNIVTVRVLDVKPVRNQIDGFCRRFGVSIYETRETERMRVDKLAWLTVIGLNEESYNTLLVQEWAREVVTMKRPQTADTSGAAPLPPIKGSKSSKKRKRRGGWSKTDYRLAAMGLPINGLTRFPRMGVNADDYR